MRLELTLANHYTTRSAQLTNLAFLLGVASGRTNGTPNETRTHLWGFANLACLLLHHPRRSGNLLSFSLHVAQGRENEAPNKTRTHSWKFASLAY